MMANIPDQQLPLSISLESSTPLYDQIESQVRQLIVANVLAAGTTLPSVRALATTLGCSVITTRRAYQDLEQKGLIRTLQGRGTIVADVSESVRKQHRLQPVADALQRAIDQARAAGMQNDELRSLLESLLQEGETQE